MATKKISRRNNRQEDPRGIVGYAIVKKLKPKLNIYDIYPTSEIKNVKVEKDEKVIKVEIKVIK